MRPRLLESLDKPAPGRHKRNIEFRSRLASRKLKEKT